MENIYTHLAASDADEISSTISIIPSEQLEEIFRDGSIEILDIIFRNVGQNSFNKIIYSISPDKIRETLSLIGEEATSNFIRLANHPYLEKILASANNDLVEHLLLSAGSRKARLNITKLLPVERRSLWTKYVKDQESEVENLKNVAKDAGASLYNDRKRLLRELDHAIELKEEALHRAEEEARIKSSHINQQVDEALSRLRMIEEEVSDRGSEIKKREHELSLRLAEFEEANRRQVQKRIEAKVPEYVAAAVRVLDEREALYRQKAKQWGIHGTLVLLTAIISVTGISLYGYAYGGPIADLSWQALVFITLKGLVVLSVLGLWAKHAFTVSNAYMHEAIKRSDRAHAINFGKLYLEIYGNSVERKELIDVFENWNITSESAFAKANPSGFEPKIIDKIADIIKAASKQSKKMEENNQRA